MSEEEGSAVFLIENDPTVRESVSTLIHSMGFAVVEFENAEDFFDAFDPNWSGCIVTDLRLRGMSGVELLEALADAGRSLPMVIITGYATTPTVVRAMRKGAITVLDKPFDTNELWQSIRDAMRQDAMNRAKQTQIADLKSRFSRLTDQERTVLRLMVHGYINKQISKHLDVSVRTIESRRQQIFRKTGARNLGELMWHAMMLRVEDDDWFGEEIDLVEQPTESAS